MAFGAFPAETNMCEPTINATLFFNTAPKVQDLLPLAQIVGSYERCAGVPEGTPGKADWRIKYVDFSPKDMIRTVEVATAGDVHGKIESILHDNLRTRTPELPWWEIVRVVPGDGGKSAVVIRIDHIIGDGISLVTLMEQILTKEGGGKLDAIIPASMSAKFNRKTSLMDKFKNFFKIIYYFFVVIGLPAGKFDDMTPFSKSANAKMVYSWKRSLVDFETMPLTYIKELKTAGKVTINDIMFSCLGGAIRKYNVSNGCEITAKKKKNVQCRALMPVAFPRPNVDNEDKTAVLRNKWVFVSSDFGVGIEDSVERLAFVNKNMTTLKTSPLAGVQLAVQETLPPKLPLKLGRQTVFDTLSRHSVIFSNVPGPDQPVSFGGQTVSEVQMYFNNLIPQIGILSYNGKVFMNMNLDTEAIPGGEMLAVFFAQELRTLSEKLKVDCPLEIIKKSEQ